MTSLRGSTGNFRCTVYVSYRVKLLLALSKLCDVVCSVTAELSFDRCKAHTLVGEKVLWHYKLQDKKSRTHLWKCQACCSLDVSCTRDDAAPSSSKDTMRDAFSVKRAAVAGADLAQEHLVRRVPVSTSHWWSQTHHTRRVLCLADARCSARQHSCLPCCVKGANVQWGGSVPPPRPSLCVLVSWRRYAGAARPWMCVRARSKRM